ncbi:unnamed protein product [Somion occarium]|uniref:Uncharacterized protein n=1 Tax=Somion occarium TaxID=3059160 RepID=A0ABP1DEM5_9APHY
MEGVKSWFNDEELRHTILGQLVDFRQNGHPREPIGRQCTLIKEARPHSVNIGNTRLMHSAVALFEGDQKVLTYRNPYASFIHWER